MSDHPTVDFDEKWKTATVEEIVNADALSKAEKLEILEYHRTEQEALQRAAGEGMEGGEETKLREVEKAIQEMERG